MRDILTVLRRRFPAVPVTIYPSSVQGDAAPAELRAALPASTSVDARATEGTITSVVDAKRREEIPPDVAAESVMEVIQYLLDPARIGMDELEAVFARAIAYAEEHGLDAQLRVEESYGSQP